jgi:hypothetical protein
MLFLGFLDLPGLLAAAATVVFQHEGHPVALVERPDSCGFTHRRVDEHVLAAAIRLNEAEALRSVKNSTVPVTRMRLSLPKSGPAAQKERKANAREGRKRDHSS